MRMRCYTINFYIVLFKKMREDNYLDDCNEIHKGFLRHCFRTLIQAELDLVLEEWSRHPIRKQKDNDVSGKPEHLYNFPEKYGFEDYKKEVDQNHIDICYEQHAEKTVINDAESEELCQLLVPGHKIPETVEEALRLFERLTNALWEFEHNVQE